MVSAASRSPIVYAITELLPHRAPMCWLDELVEIGAESITTRLVIRDTAPFYETEFGMPAWVGLEYMAQTVAAFSGHERVTCGLQPQIGLLLGTRHYRSSVGYFRLGAVLDVHARLLLRDESDLVAFACEIRCDGAVLAQADVKAIRPDDLQSVLARSYSAT
jgi:predicted hotdog family 3-hydroxylacyl-ACP dehydratase